MTSFPEWLVPMAATLTQERFTGPEWIFERKFDGIRLLAYKQGGDVQLFSRNHLPQDLPQVQKAIAHLPHKELILDGEITWRGGKVAYHIFDLMWIDGRNVAPLPLEERQALLAQRDETVIARLMQPPTLCAQGQVRPCQLHAPGKNWSAAALGQIRSPCGRWPNVLLWSATCGPAC
jgi:ATP-dependent DNA ligase